MDVDLLLDLCAVRPGAEPRIFLYAILFSMRRSVQIKGVAILALLMLTLCIWYAVIQEDRRGLLTVSFLDIGQGDAIFIEAPSGRQVLIDGGPGASVLQRLGEVIPW